jgi:hypothetical protein
MKTIIRLIIKTYKVLNFFPFQKYLTSVSELFKISEIPLQAFAHVLHASQITTDDTSQASSDYHAIKISGLWKMTAT